MTQNSSDGWLVQPLNLFRLYNPQPAEGIGARGTILLEVDRTIPEDPGL